MRASQSLRKEIESKRQTMKKHERRIYEIKKEIRALQTTLSKAIGKEEIEKSGIAVKIESVEQTEALERMALFLVKATVIETREKIEWLEIKRKHRKGKVYKITPRELAGFLEAQKRMKEKKEESKE